MDEKKDEKDEKYKTLVISGGGTKGFAALGVLQALFDGNKTDFNHYIGTSVGSIINYLLCIGYSPIEIMISVAQTTLLQDLSVFNIANIMSGNGVTRWNIVHEFLEKLTINKIGYLPTLLKIYENFSKKLTICTYNNTKKKKEILDYKTFPDLPCLIAIRMSCNLPLIFDRFKYMNSYYLDGGLIDNFPIHLVDNTKGLGINLYTDVITSNDDEFSFLNYIYDIICIPMNENNKIKNQKFKETCKIIEIDIKDIKIFEFDLTVKKQLNLFSLGYRSL